MASPVDRLVHLSDQLYLRSRCDVGLGHGDLNLVGSGEYCKDYDFSISKSGQLIKLRLSKDGKTIMAETVINNINPDIIQILKTNDYDSLNKTERDKLREIEKPIVDSMRELVALIKQE